MSVIIMQVYRYMQFKVCTVKQVENISKAKEDTCGEKST